MTRPRCFPEMGRYLQRTPATPLVPVQLDAGFPPIWCKLEFLNPSSGLNYAAAVVADRTLPTDSFVVTVFPDRMDRYFSTELFDPFRQSTKEETVHL
ncbi:hypothetical protein IV102_12145 [bacterium]|nr:hypothetical protein [bacterium]